MKSWRRAEAKERRNFGAGVSLEVVPVTQLVVRGKKPFRIRLDALQRSNVVLEIDVPARGMRIFLSFGIGRERIKIRFLPEAVRQRGETEPGVELFRGL